MTGYLLRRALLALPTLLGAATLVFILLHLIPGDPAQVMLGEAASAADVARLRQRLGLDQPLAAQYGDFLRRLLRADLGQSFHYQDDVTSLLWERLPATLTLAAATLALALAVALPVGLATALRPGRSLDRASSMVAAMALAVPSFWLGPMLVIVFSIWLNWLPVSGADRPDGIILPAATLALSTAALLARMLKAALEPEVRAPYVLAARARGRPRTAAVARHSLRNAAGPVLTTLALQAGSLLTGAILTETIFAWPGLGRLLVRAIGHRDYPLVQGCVLLFAAIYVLTQMACDVARAALDPRVAD